jgi:hypothetical protein
MAHGGVDRLQAGARVYVPIVPKTVMFPVSGFGYRNAEPPYIAQSNDESNDGLAEMPSLSNELE